VTLNCPTFDLGCQIQGFFETRLIGAAGSIVAHHDLDFIVFPCLLIFCGNCAKNPHPAASHVTVAHVPACRLSIYIYYFVIKKAPAFELLLPTSKIEYRPSQGQYGARSIAFFHPIYQAHPGLWPECEAS